MNTKKSNLEKISDYIVIGTAILAVGITIGSLYRRGEIDALKEMNRELLRESEKKTWYLGKQFAEYIKRHGRTVRVFFV
jgi:hypothetical protein